MTLSNLPKLLISAVIIIGIGRVAWLALAPADQQQDQAEIRLPQLTQAAQAGQAAFQANCAQCHGPVAGGTEKGPPLIHPIYNPGHHGDLAFRRAVAEGSRAHHWQFGDMPAQKQVSPRQAEDIIAFVREVQRANGITYQEHRM